MAAKRAFAGVVLDRAAIYASGGDVTQPLNFERFRAFLFDPLDGRKGPSIAELLEQNNIITKESFEDYKTLINQSADIAQVMRDYGPQSVERLQDKAALLSNIVIRGLGAIGGNVIVNRLKGIFGNVPGASMSVAQTTSNATAELGLNMPAMKVQDIYIRAMTEPDLMRVLLSKPPKTEKKAIEYFRSLPAIFYASGVRGGVEEVQQTETGRTPVNYVEEVYRDVVPQPQPEPTPTEPRPTGPLSIQNNNPGNLRLAGQPGATEGQGGFAAFSSPGQGLRALTRQVVLDTQTRGMNLEDFLNKYAPPSENQTSKYIAFVERQTGLDAKSKVPESKIPQLVRAIVRMEGGQEAVDYFYGQQRAEAAPAPQPPIAQAAPPMPPAPAPVSPQSLQRAAQILGPQDEIGMLASEMLMRQRPA